MPAPISIGTENGAKSVFEDPEEGGAALRREPLAKSQKNSTDLHHVHHVHAFWPLKEACKSA